MESAASLIHVCELARGGMGRVEIAVRKEDHFERLFAVKRLHTQYANDTGVREMFIDEARIAGLIQHPNVVHVLDVGRDDDGPFLVMEYVEGLSLSQLLRSEMAAKRQLPISVVLDIMRQVALGLNAAHELLDGNGRRIGLIHRDVSPQNVLVSYEGCARLTDFGIAKASERLTKTQTGVLKGKYGYLSPEQLRFEDPVQQSDLFSFGVVLYELLAARRLYGGEGLKAARRILNDPPPDLADDRDDLPDEIVALLFRLLAKDPAHRPTTAKEVAQILQSAAESIPRDERVEVGEYMQARYAETRERRRASIAEVVTNIKVAPTPSTVVVAHPVEARSRRATWLVAAGLTVAAVGGLAWSSWEPAIPAEVPIESAAQPPTERRFPESVPIHEPVVSTPEAASQAVEDTPATMESSGEPNGARRRPRASMRRERTTRHGLPVNPDW